MNRRDKVLLLLFLGLAAVAIFLAAAGLSRLVLEPGQPFSLLAGEGAGGGGGPLFNSDWLAWLIRGITALALILTPFYILYSLFSKRGRRRLLGDLLVLAVLMGFVYLLSKNAAPLPEPEVLPELGEPGSNVPTPAPAPDPFVAQTPDWLEILASVGVALLLTAAVGLAYRWWLSRRPPEFSPALDRLGEEAQRAVDALYAGGDVKDTVIRSYLQMSRILHEERGIQRGSTMTPQEFEGILVRKGFPREPVQRLTRLFEEVRYGARRPAEAEEQAAIASLSAIADFCRSPQGEAA